MSKKEPAVRYSADELRAMVARSGADKPPGRPPTNDEIERAAASDPDDDLSIDWSQIAVSLPRNKSGVFLRLDPEVLEHFRAAGPGHQTRINAVLRAYVEAQGGARRTG